MIQPSLWKQSLQRGIPSKSAYVFSIFSKVNVKVMQSMVQKSTYAYDSQGRLVSQVESGASNDVVSSHVLLDPRLPGPKHITEVLTAQPEVVQYKAPTVNTPRSPLMSTIVPPTQQGNVLTSPHLYSDPVSKLSPPTNRSRTLHDLVNPFGDDAGGITVSTPILSVQTSPRT